MIERREPIILRSPIIHISTAVVLVVHYVHGGYLNLSNISGGLLHRADDLPATVFRNQFPPVLGVHYFGDLLDGHNSVASTGSGGYFGISYLFFFITRAFSYKTVFLCYLGSSALLLLLSLKIWLRRIEKSQRSIVFFFHLSYPFIFGLDRGQVSVPMGYLLMIGLLVVTTENRPLLQNCYAGGSLGAAFSMKLYPSFIMISFPKIWNVKKWGLVLAPFVVLLILSVVVTPDGISHLLYQIRPQSTYQDAGYLKATIQYNTSFRALIEFLSQTNADFLSKLLDLLRDKYQLLMAIFSILAALLLNFVNVSLPERVLVASILSVSIAPIAPIYSQVIVVGSGLLYLTSSAQICRFRALALEVVLLVTIVPHNFPVDFGFNGPGTFTTQSVVVPFVQLVYVAGMVATAPVRLYRSSHKSANLR